jgi:hypothetical protein
MKEKEQTSTAQQPVVGAAKRSQTRSTLNAQRSTLNVQFNSTVILSRPDGEGPHLLESKQPLAPSVVFPEPALARRLCVSELGVGCWALGVRRFLFLPTTRLIGRSARRPKAALPPIAPSIFGHSSVFK